MCLCVGMFTWDQKKGGGSPRASVTGSCGLSDTLLGTEPGPLQEQYTLFFKRFIFIILFVCICALYSCLVSEEIESLHVVAGNGAWGFHKNKKRP